MEEMKKLRRDMRDMFERFGREWQSFWKEANQSVFGSEDSNGFPIDLTEDDAAFYVTADMAGIDENNINIELVGDKLTIHCERQQTDAKKSHISERRFGSADRTFTLPDGIDRGHIDAKFDKGVLTITLPKTTEVPKPKTIKINSQ